MHREALGFIETLGMIPALEAADSCVKSANVKFLGYERSTGGLVTIKIEGDVGAVKAAIDAGKASAQKLGVVISTLVIPRPANDIDYMVSGDKEIKKEVKDNKDENKEEIKAEANKEEVKQVETKELQKIQETEDIEEKIKEDRDNSKEELQTSIDDNEIKKKRNVCNLCYDPKCTRKKGQPKTLCIHYKSK